MDLHLSIKAKLVMAADARQELKSTLEEFNRACNTLSELAFQRDLHRRYDIHHQGYRLIRQETSLPSQHVINATPGRTINGSSLKISTGFVRPARRNAFTNGVSLNFNR
jgi:hypothetical protein